MLTAALSLSVLINLSLAVIAILFAVRAIREEKSAKEQLKEQIELSQELSTMYRNERAKHNITKLCMKAFYGVEK